MPLVIDISLMAGWYFPDERTATSDAVLALVTSGREVALVPGIWWFELHNVLLQGERRGRSTVEQANHFLSFLHNLPITITANPEAHSILSLARRHHLTFYDAAYLELAQREGVALATLDQALARAATAERVPLIGA